MGGCHLDIWQQLDLVSVNLSATLLGDFGFMNWLEMRLMAEPELVDKLCIEITGNRGRESARSSDKVTRYTAPAQL